MTVDNGPEARVASVWRCDACGKVFRLNRGETLVHTAETGHGSFHAESYIVQTSGLRSITIVKKPADTPLPDQKPDRRSERDHAENAARG